MAISWGAWEYSGGNGMRLGFESSWSTVTHTSTTVTLTTDIYTENQYWYDDSQVITYSGGFSGTTSFSNTSSGGAVKRATKTYTYTYGANSYGSSPGSVTVGAVLSGAYNGVTPGASLTYTIPGRPYAAPAAPSAVTQAPEGSSWRISWQDNPTAGEPVTNSTWERWRASDGFYTEIGTTTAETWLTNTCPNNDRYRARVYSTNPAGNSAYGYGAYFKTTPANPSNVKAVKTATAGQITLTWTNNAPYVNNFQIKHFADGVDQGVVSSPISTATSATFSGLNTSQTHRYEIRAVTTEGFTFYSSYVSSNTVELDSPPAAPTGLSPNGATRNATSVIRVSWTHNPTDSSPQAYREVGRRLAGGSWTTTGKVASTANYYDFPANTFVNGNNYEWEVRTWGSHPDPSPYSVATIKTSSPPAASVTSPTAAQVLTGATVTAQLSFSDEEGHNISLWECWLKNTATGVELQRRTGTPAAGVYTASAAFSTRLSDNSSYSISVKCTDSTGMTSNTTTVNFTTDFLEPGPATLTATWVEDSAAVDIAITNATTSPVAVSNDIERSLDGGQTWETIARGLPVDGAYRDFSPNLVGLTHYRVVSVSALPSMATSTEVSVEATTACSAFVSVGIDYALEVKYNREVPARYGSRATVHRLALPRPVAIYPLEESPDLSISVSGFIKAGGNSEAEWAQMLRGNVFYRDVEGRRFTGAVTDLTFTPAYLGTNVSFTVVEVEP